MYVSINSIISTLLPCLKLEQRIVDKMSGHLQKIVTWYLRSGTNKKLCSHWCPPGVCPDTQCEHDLSDIDCNKTATCTLLRFVLHFHLNALNVTRSEVIQLFFFYTKGYQLRTVSGDSTVVFWTIVFPHRSDHWHISWCHFPYPVSGLANRMVHLQEDTDKVSS